MAPHVTSATFSKLNSIAPARTLEDNEITFQGKVVNSGVDVMNLKSLNHAPAWRMNHRQLRTAN
jgi:hypothetical protein